MKVLIVSHAMAQPAARGDITELAGYVDVQVVTPESMAMFVFPKRGLRGRASWRGEVGMTYHFDPDGLGGEYFSPLPSWRPFGTQYLLRSLSLGMRRFSPDVVHIDYEPWALLFHQAVLASRLFAANAPLVCGIKKNTYRNYPGLLGLAKRQIALAGTRSVDHYIAASKMAADSYVDVLGVPGRRISVLPRVGVDVESFRPLRTVPNQGRPLIVGYAGRMREHKGVPELLAAVANARSEGGWDLHLHMVGDGPLLPLLRARAENEPWLRAEPHISHSAIPAFLNSLDLFVMPTRVMPDSEEHDGQAIVEALAAGVPVVGTRSGVIPELLGHGAGELVEANSVVALTDGICKLARDEHKRKKLSAVGRRRAETNFSLAEVARRKAGLYRSVLDEARH